MLSAAATATFRNLLNAPNGNTFPLSRSLSSSSSTAWWPLLCFPTPGLPTSGTSRGRRCRVIPALLGLAPAPRCDAHGQTTRSSPVTHQGVAGGFGLWAIGSDAGTHLPTRGCVWAPVGFPSSGETTRTPAGSAFSSCGSCWAASKARRPPAEDGVPVSPYFVPKSPVFLAVAVPAGTQWHLASSWFVSP